MLIQCNAFLQCDILQLHRRLLCWLRRSLLVLLLPWRRRRRRRFLHRLATWNTPVFCTIRPASFDRRYPFPRWLFVSLIGGRLFRGGTSHLARLQQFLHFLPFCCRSIPFSRSDYPFLHTWAALHTCFLDPCFRHCIYLSSLCCHISHSLSTMTAIPLISDNGMSTFALFLAVDPRTPCFPRSFLAAGRDWCEWWSRDKLLCISVRLSSNEFRADD